MAVLLIGIRNLLTSLRCRLKSVRVTAITQSKTVKTISSGSMTMRSRRRPIQLANTHSCFGIKRSRHFSARHCELDLPGFACYACTDRHHARSEGEIMPLKIDDKELFAIDSHTHMGRRS